LTPIGSTGRSGSAGAADTLILLPSLGYSEGLLEALPYTRYLGERSLSELETLRDPSMRVVLVTAEKIDPWIIDHTLADFSAGDEALQRDMHRRVACLVPDPSGAPLADSVLADHRTMARLHDETRPPRSALLVNFAASQTIDELAEQLGVPAEEAPAGPAHRWGTKAGSKTLFREGGVLCPRGDLDVVRSVAAATSAAQRLAFADSPPERVIVRLNASTWADGFGNAVVRCSTLRRTGDLHQSIETLPQPWDAYCRELEADGAIVEEYIGNATCSPSAQARLGAEGELELLAAHEQILDAGEYLGCRFPIEHDTADVLLDAMTRVGTTLKSHGVRGTFGVDFIISGGRSYATEINLRKIGPSHVIQTIRALIGGAGADRGGAILGMPVAYVHRRLHRPSLFTALTPQSAMAALRRDGLSYDRGTRSGTVLHIMGALGPVGYVETTSVATTPADARDIDERAVEVLSATARHTLVNTPSAR
jgi:hypothetical protein